MQFSPQLQWLGQIKLLRREAATPRHVGMEGNLLPVGKWMEPFFRLAKFCHPYFEFCIAKQKVLMKCNL